MPQVKQLTKKEQVMANGDNGLGEVGLAGAGGQIAIDTDEPAGEGVFTDDGHTTSDEKISGEEGAVQGETGADLSGVVSDALPGDIGLAHLEEAAGVFFEEGSDKDDIFALSTAEETGIVASTEETIASTPDTGEAGPVAPPVHVVGEEAAQGNEAGIGTVIPTEEVNTEKAEAIASPVQVGEEEIAQGTEEAQKDMSDASISAGGAEEISAPEVKAAENTETGIVASTEGAFASAPEAEVAGSAASAPVVKEKTTEDAMPVVPISAGGAEEISAPEVKAAENTETGIVASTEGAFASAPEVEAVGAVEVEPQATKSNEVESIFIGINFADLTMTKEELARQTAIAKKRMEDAEKAVAALSQIEVGLAQIAAVEAAGILPLSLTEKRAELIETSRRIWAIIDAQDCNFQEYLNFADLRELIQSSPESERNAEAILGALREQGYYREATAEEAAEYWNKRDHNPGFYLYYGGSVFVPDNSQHPSGMVRAIAAEAKAYFAIIDNIVAEKTRALVEEMRERGSRDVLLLSGPQPKPGVYAIDLPATNPKDAGVMLVRVAFIPKTKKGERVEVPVLKLIDVAGPSLDAYILKGNKGQYVLSATLHSYSKAVDQGESPKKILTEGIYRHTNKASLSKEFVEAFLRVLSQAVKRARYEEKQRR